MGFSYVPLPRLWHFPLFLVRGAFLSWKDGEVCQMLFFCTHWDDHMGFVLYSINAVYDMNWFLDVHWGSPRLPPGKMIHWEGSEDSARSHYHGVTLTAKFSHSERIQSRTRKVKQHRGQSPEEPEPKRPESSPCGVSIGHASFLQQRSWQHVWNVVCQGSSFETQYPRF